MQIRVLPLLAVAVVAGWCTGTPARAAQSPPVTYTKDVAPILFEQCATCHRPGEVAPMSLLSYSDARPWAKAIKTKVVARLGESLAEEEK